MVGIVVVSHSAELARGVVELARQMGGEEVRVEEAGGMDDGSIGTDAARVQAAIERAMSDDGVLVLMDLGSALMSAEMAVELMEGDGRVVLSEAPLVEGAVAAAAAARGGASLDEVRAEAGRAFAASRRSWGSRTKTRQSRHQLSRKQLSRRPMRARRSRSSTRSACMRGRPRWWSSWPGDSTPTCGWQSKAAPDRSARAA